MAYIDYGAVAFKNGHLIKHESFTTSMQHDLGWTPTSKDFDTDHKLINNCENAFAYIGDRKNFIAITNSQIDCYSLISNERGDSEHGEYNEYIHEHAHFAWTDANYKWSKWYSTFLETRCVVTHKYGYYKLKWKYEGNTYKVFFGYGVDEDFYRRTHLLNAYYNIFTRIKRYIRNHIKTSM